MRIVACPCGTSFEVPQWRHDAGRGKYCSNPCKYRYRVRPSGLTYKKHKENPTSFALGHTRTPRGEAHPSWKGNDVGYRQLHDWVRSQREYPEGCEHCGATGWTEWANLSHEYKRDIKDWAALCRSCHRSHDRDSRGAATAKFGVRAVQRGYR